MFQESSISDGKVLVLGVPAVGRGVGMGGMAVWDPAQSFSPLPARVHGPAAYLRPESWAGGGPLSLAARVLKTTQVLFPQDVYLFSVTVYR